VVPDLQHRETGAHTHRRKRSDTSNQPGAQLARNGVAVNDCGSARARIGAASTEGANSSIRGFLALVQPAGAIFLIARGAFRIMRNALSSYQTGAMIL